MKGGGNHASGASSAEDGVVIDLSNLNSVSVDTDKGQVTIGGGCRWGDVYSALHKHGLICVGGGVHIVGVGGHLTGGNYVYLLPILCSRPDVSLQVVGVH